MLSKYWPALSRRAARKAEGHLERASQAIELARVARDQGEPQRSAEMLGHAELLAQTEDLLDLAEAWQAHGDLDRADALVQRCIRVTGTHAHLVHYTALCKGDQLDRAFKSAHALDDPAHIGEAAAALAGAGRLEQARELAGLATKTAGTSALAVQCAWTFGVAPALHDLAREGFLQGASKAETEKDLLDAARGLESLGDETGAWLVRLGTRPCQRRGRRRFVVSHPMHPNAEAAFGWDRALGFFVSIQGLSGNRSYDLLHPNYNHRRPMLGAVLFLVEQGFVPRPDLQAPHPEATRWELHATVHWRGFGRACAACRASSVSTRSWT
jgi:hypothetical protein